MSGKIRVLLADDHPLVRTGLRAALAPEADVELIGEAADGEETRRLARELRPDVLLLDVSMPGPPAAQTVAAVRADCPETKVLALTAYHNPVLTRGLFAAGVAGYVLKDEPNAAVVQAIRAVARGVTWLSGPVMDLLLQAEVDRPLEAEATSLTSQELAVLRLMVVGKADPEIARALKISERTVRRHLRSIYDRLNVHTRVGAAVRALRLGLVDT